MVMLDILRKMSGAYDWDLSVVTVDHSLRLASKSDCQFVVKTCEKLDIKCFAEKVDVKKLVETSGMSTEAAARKLRYEVFDKLSKNFDYVCLAHHMSDYAETTLFNILRGSGSRGANAMSLLNGKYARPLLFVKKEQIEEYAKQNNIQFVIDETNSQNIYSRNFLRNEIFPQLKDLNSKAIENIVNFAETTKSDNDFIYSFLDTTKIVVSDFSAFIPQEILLQHNAIAVRAVLFALSALKADRDVTRQHLFDAVNLKNMETNKQVSLPNGFFAIRTYDGIKICQRQEKTFFQYPFDIGVFDFDKVVVKVENCLPKFQYTTAKGRLLVADIDKIPRGSVLRNPLDDDVFCKGVGGSCKLKKHLSDRKIDLLERQNMVVLANGNNVLAILGLDISKEICLQEDTLNAVELKCETNIFG